MSRTLARPTRDDAEEGLPICSMIKLVASCFGENPRRLAASFGNLLFGIWKTTWSKSVGLAFSCFKSWEEAEITCWKYAGSPVNLPPWLGYFWPSRRQKSGVLLE